MKTKICRECGKPFPLKELAKNKACRGGRAALCIECARQLSKKTYKRLRAEDKGKTLFELIMKDRVAIEKRFWIKVKKLSGKNACWEWTGNTTWGYPLFNIRGRSTRGNRVAYLLEFGDFPEDLQVCHHCDNKCCVRPSHLFLGTQEDNVYDSICKNRKPQGQNHPNSKLTTVKVYGIRRKAAEGIPQRALGRKYGVSQRTIWRIIHYKTWKHV